MIRFQSRPGFAWSLTALALFVLIGGANDAQARIRKARAPTGTTTTTATSTTPSTIATSNCGVVNEYAPYPTAGTLPLACPAGQTITKIDFVSWGTPTGTCPSLAAGACNATTALAIAQAQCLGKTACTLTASNSVFGDPCSGTSKQLAAQVSCGTSTVVATPTPVPTLVPNVNPISNAAYVAPITLPQSTAMLDGSQSSDPDGKIVAYTWTQASGPNSATFMNATGPNAIVSGLVAGTYRFNLVVTDDRGGQNLDYTDLVVNPGTVAVTPPVVVVAPSPTPSPAPVVVVTPPVSTPPVVTTPGSGSQAKLALGVIPFSDPEFTAPGRGLEYWIYQWVVPYPTATSTYAALDHYSRFEWRAFQNASATTYDFSKFDAQINQAIAAGQKFSFSVMNQCSGCTDFTVQNAGAALSYPDYLHNLMQLEAQPDRNSNGVWIPNWNSATYITAWKNLQTAIANHIATGSYNGVAYSKVIDRIDIRGYGDFGEWHLYPYSDNPATNGGPVTVASLNAIIDATVSAFPNYQLEAMVNGFATGDWSNIPAAVAYRLATGSNAHGRFGWRKDSWGATEAYWNNPLNLNTATYNGSTLWTYIQDIWKSAPVTGEPYQCCTANGGTGLYWDLERQVRTYHLSILGNGNLENSGSADTQNNMRAAGKAAGYRLQVNSGSYTNSVAADRKLTVALNWRNVGIAPTYEDWDVNFELRKSGTTTAVWSGTSSMVLRLYLPESADRAVQDTFALPVAVTTGTYDLVMIVRDRNGYRKPLPLANTGRTADGAYPLGSVGVP